METLAAVVAHCPAGPDALVDALQLHLTAAGPWAGDAELHANGEDDAAAVQADLRTARDAARAWALVLQWVANVAPRSAARGALARLADVGVSLLCWPPRGDDSAVAAVAAAASRQQLAQADAARACSNREQADAAAPLEPGLRRRHLPDGPGSEAGRADAYPAEPFDPDDPQPSDAVCRHQGFLAGQQLMVQVR